MIITASSDEDPVYQLSSSSSPDWIPTLSGNCAVCGDCVSSSRLGCPACLGCIVFFRRAVIHGTKYKCLKDENCLINYEYRSTCRFCRLQKCHKVGMKSSAVRQRDAIGPRVISPDSHTRTNIPNYYKPIPHPPPIMEFLMKLQSRQIQEHKNEGIVYRRRASHSDVNRMLKWGFSNAIEWASNFEPFRKLSNESQKCVLSEYGIAFFLIDQGFKSVRDADHDFWFLQNGSYIHPNYYLGLMEGCFDVDPKDVENHQNFSDTLTSAIKDPFKALDIDEFEVAALKTLLLLTPSFPKEGIFVIYEDKMAVKRKRCLKELMAYFVRKCPDRPEERFGEIILLIGEIRNTVKEVYNQTKKSEIFNSRKFDPYVQSFLLT